MNVASSQRRRYYPPSRDKHPAVSSERFCDRQGADRLLSADTAQELRAMPRLPQRRKSDRGLPASKQRGLLDAVQTINRNQEWRSLIMNQYAGITLAVMAGGHGLAAARLALTAPGLACVAAGNAPAAAACLAGAMGMWAGSVLLLRLTNELEKCWKDRAYDAFVKRLIELNGDRPDAWSQEAYRRELDTWVGPQGQNVIDGTVGAVYATAQCAMGTLANAAAMASVVTPWMLPAILGSGALALGYNALRETGRARRATHMQEAQRQVTTVTAGMTDNVMLGNTYNQEVWNERLGLAQAERDRARRGLLGHNSLDDAAITITSAVGPAGFMVYWAAQGASQALSALSAAPNLITLLSNYSACLQLWGRWSNARATMQNMLNRSQPGSMQEWNSRLQHVAANHAAFTVTRNGAPISLQAILDWPEILQTPARWTFNAPNGAGKSTLMRAIATYFGDRNVVYLPPSSRLFFRDDAQGSSGQIAYSQILELGERAQAHMLILDEWDAFLDGNNQQNINAQIEIWSQQYAVIEIRQSRGVMHAGES